jgi:hypothetical protein
MWVVPHGYADISGKKEPGLAAGLVLDQGKTVWAAGVLRENRGDLGDDLTSPLF